MTYGGSAYGSQPYASSLATGSGTTDGTASVTGSGSTTALATVIAGSSATGAGSTSAAGQSLDAYAAAVLSDNPLFYWRLGEPSGTTAADATGNGRAGTYVNTPTLGATGIPGAAGDTAVTFDPAQSEKVTIADAAWMDVTNLTFECWVKVADMPNSSVNLLANRELAFQLRVVTGTGTASIDARVFGTDLIYVDLDTIASGVTVDNNQWRHIALTHDGSTARIYIDGTQRGSGALAYNINASTWAIDVADPYGLSMTVDEVAYYGTALSTARISAHYSAGNPQDADGTASVTGTGSVTALATIVAGASVTGEGATTATPNGTFLGTATVTGTGSVTATGTSTTVSGTSSVVGEGSVLAIHLSPTNLTTMTRDPSVSGRLLLDGYVLADPLPAVDPTTETAAIKRVSETYPNPTLTNGRPT